MTGIALRDYFAAAALQGDLASLQIDSRRFGILMQLSDTAGIRMSLVIAREAYEQADAMLEARNPIP